MGSFNKLSETFDRDKDDEETSSVRKEPSDPESMIRQSKAIVNAIDKLKRQGIPVTKKAELDYLLALRYLEKHRVFDSEDEEEPEEEIIRNPKDHPKEFEVARAHSQKTVRDIESMMEKGIKVSDKKLEEYELCKKFLRKYK